MTEKKGRQEFEAELIVKAWKNEAFKREIISNPKAVYARELGQQLPEDLNIRVMEETSDTIYLVLPTSPQVSEELSDEALEAVAGGYLVTPGTIFHGGYTVTEGGVVATHPG